MAINKSKSIKYVLTNQNNLHFEVTTNILCLMKTACKTFFTHAHQKLIKTDRKMNAKESVTVTK